MPVKSFWNVTELQLIHRDVNELVLSYYSVMYSTVYHRPQQLFYMPDLVLLALCLLFSKFCWLVWGEFSISRGYSVLLVG